jgi:hypothetical protein
MAIGRICTLALRSGLAFASALTSMSAPAANLVGGADAVVGPDVPVHDATQGIWSVRWWQWAASFSYEDSPIADRTGELCAAGQQGPVWFLAGVYGSSPVLRSCVVPAGKFLFFPIVNFVVSSNPRGPSSCQSVVATAKEMTDYADDLTLIVDGEEVRNLESFRQVSPQCFNLGERIQQNVSPTAANGYFVMLRPLSPGRHVIKWGGALPSVRQAVVYELTVGAAD